MKEITIKSKYIDSILENRFKIFDLLKKEQKKANAKKTGGSLASQSVNNFLIGGDANLFQYPSNPSAPASIPINTNSTNIYSGLSQGMQSTMSQPLNTSKPVNNVAFSPSQYTGFQPLLNTMSRMSR